ncbi:MAG: hypothetical protein PHE53_01525 [Thermoguttaceae bacterium]|nr:hypothetical protein [Thermoguttaceae bacterium]
MKMNSVRSFYSCLLLCGLFLTLSGCGKANPDGRENVSGTVKINGEPVKGTAGIRFDPIGEDKTAGGSGQIMESKYLLTQQDGVKPGKYIVRINAKTTFDRKTGKVADNTLKFGNEVDVELVPPEYNTQSKQEVEIVAGGKNVFDFDIKSDIKPDLSSANGEKKKKEVEL